MTEITLARVQQIEGVAGLDALIIGRQRHQMPLALALAREGEQSAAFGLGGAEIGERLRVRGPYVVNIPVRLPEDIAIGDLVLVAAVEIQLR